MSLSSRNRNQMVPIVLKFGGGCFVSRHALKLVVQRIQQASTTGSRVHIVASAPRGVTSALLALQSEAPGRTKLTTLQGMASTLRHAGLLTETMFQPHILNEQRGHQLVFAGEQLSTQTLLHQFDQGTYVDTSDLIVTNKGMLNLPQIVANIQGWYTTLPSTTRHCFHIGYFCRETQTNALSDLGRNGSELTAAVLGSSLHAKRMVFYKAECTTYANGLGLQLASKKKQRRWLGLLDQHQRTIPRMSWTTARVLTANNPVLHPYTCVPLCDTFMELHIANLVVAGGTYIG